MRFIDLADVDRLLRTMAAPDRPPPELRERTLAAVGQAQPSAAPAPRARRRLPKLRLRWAAGVAAAAAAAVAIVVVAGREPGTLELRTELRAANGAVATAEVREIGIGRTIEFSSDDLPILPRGEYYELWFVGPGDRPGRPNRISAGTFHPDADGRSNVELKAAVDPALYRPARPGHRRERAVLLQRLAVGVQQ